ncbi:hypothetical protein RKD54_004400 [Pseudarthrobacter sp. SLBN-100]
MTGAHTVLDLPTETVDFEAELVVVIGKEAFRVSEADAWDHVAGLTVGNDISERTRQRIGPAPQFSLGNSFPGFTPIGPWLVTPDEFADRDDLGVGCSINGKDMQDGRTNDLIFPIQGPLLGVALESGDEDGDPVLGQTREMVVTRPMPSMPICFWNDAGTSEYAEAYFDRYPGIWRHGDGITMTEHGGVVIHGRSDATINRMGVRIGSSEIGGRGLLRYRAQEGHTLGGHPSARPGRRHHRRSPASHPDRKEARSACQTGSPRLRPHRRREPRSDRRSPATRPIRQLLAL